MRLYVRICLECGKVFRSEYRVDCCDLACASERLSSARRGLAMLRGIMAEDERQAA